MSALDDAKRLVARGNVDVQAGRLTEALAKFEAASAILPNHPGILNNCGVTLEKLGRLEEALNIYERVLTLAPPHHGILNNCAVVLRKLKRPLEALERVGQALALQPDFAEGYTNRGRILDQLNRPSDALASFDLSLKFRPDNADTWSNRAIALANLDRLPEALASADRALAIAPRHADALYNRSSFLNQMKQFEEAARGWVRALEVDPEQPYVRGHLLATQLQCCKWTDYEAVSSAIVASIESGKRADIPFSFASHCTAPFAQLACARLFTAAEFEMNSPASETSRPARRERIRLAYASADFHDHATAVLMAELFERHDRSRFEVTALSYGMDDSSPMRARLEKAFDRFVDVRGMHDKQVAALMRDDGIDIAVDLKGHTDKNRFGIFAFRGAPLQVSYLGFPATTGASFIDYIIADRHVIPPRLDAAYSEKIVRLPDSYQVNDRKRSVADDAPSRTEAGLPERGFVFCSFNNNYKIRPAIFDVWMNLLGAVEGSVLWLLDDNAAAVAHLKAAAESRGISSSRLVFAPRERLDRHLARHRLADLFLDTFPVNAHTTASDALWAGLPLVTLQGETFISRVASSLLSAVGLPELITRNLSDYERLALRLAREPSELARLKTHLESVRLTAPLFDTDRFRSHIESAYTTMYERSRSGEPPASFDVV